MIAEHRGYGSRSASAMSLPILRVPERKSSVSALRGSDSRQSSVCHLPASYLDGPVDPASIIPSYGLSNSPVKKALEREAVSSETLRRSPSKTVVRTSPPFDVLDSPTCRHSRIALAVDVSAPLFVGGGTLEGKAHLEVDDEQSRKTRAVPISISKLCVDVVGVEEISDGKRWVFLSLACEVIDREHPPPFSLVLSQSPMARDESSWPLKPSSVDVPFCLNLPLNLGPPPYSSKQARIRYVLAVTALVYASGKSSIVRQSRDVQLLTVYDPEKALASLPNPLLASDALSLPGGPSRRLVKLTAGLHRQTWVNASQIFVDIHVLNNTSKSLKRMEAQVEKRTLWYSYAAASMAERSAGHLRLPKRIDTDVVATTVLKKCKAWKGIPKISSELRTLAVEVPHGHVTISTGRYFEVRYFLNVIVGVSVFKNLIVQLPITLIHLNSLDIVPNSLAQVAAAIEAKRARCVPVPDEASRRLLYHQGQAFTVSRRQSLEQNRKDDIDDYVDTLQPQEIGALTDEIEQSPRKSAMRSKENARGRNQMNKAALSAQCSYMGDCKGGSENIPPQSPRVDEHCHDCAKHTSPGTHYHRRNKSSGSSTTLSHPKIPRLQLSTSGLGFTDSEFSFEKESPPRKVMLSESERRTLHLQRELQLARQRSIPSQTREHAEVVARTKSDIQGPPGARHRSLQGRSDRNGYEPRQVAALPAWKWKNVAAPAEIGSTLIRSESIQTDARSADPFKGNELDRPASVAGRPRQSFNTGTNKPRFARAGHERKPKARVSFERSES